MSAYRTTRARWLTGIAVGCLVLAIALSHEPAVAGTSHAVDVQAMTVGISVPLNEIQDGQFCQAYALVYNGTPPYTFSWSGQFDNSDGEYGPLGEDQIVNGYVSAVRGDLTLEVWDAASNYAEHTAELNIHWSNDFNDWCDA